MPKKPPKSTHTSAMSMRPATHRAFLAILSLNFVLLIATLLAPSLKDTLALQADHVGTLRGLVEMLTSMWAHGGIGHFLGNMLFVMCFALYLERKVGSLAFAKYWLICGLGGTVCFLLTPTLMPWTACLGSSGACFGIATMACMAVDEHPLMRSLAILALLVMALPEYGGTVVGFLIPTGVAHSAHLGGFITGLILSGGSHAR